MFGDFFKISNNKVFLSSSIPQLLCVAKSYFVQITHVPIRSSLQITVNMYMYDPLPSAESYADSGPWLN